MAGTLNRVLVSHKIPYKSFVEASHGRGGKEDKGVMVLQDAVSVPRREVDVMCGLKSLD